MEATQDKTVSMSKCTNPSKQEAPKINGVTSTMKNVNCSKTGKMGLTKTGDHSANRGK